VDNAKSIGKSRPYSKDNPHGFAKYGAKAGDNEITQYGLPTAGGGYVRLNEPPGGWPKTIRTRKALQEGGTQYHIAKKAKGPFKAGDPAVLKAGQGYSRGTIDVGGRRIPMETHDPGAMVGGIQKGGTKPKMPGTTKTWPTGARTEQGKKIFKDEVYTNKESRRRLSPEEAHEWTMKQLENLELELNEISAARDAAPSYLKKMFDDEIQRKIDSWRNYIE
jgi:hypothetical protein